MPLHSMLLKNWEVGQSQFMWDIRQNEKIRVLEEEVQRLRNEQGN